MSVSYPVEVSARMRADTTTKGRSRSQSSLEAPYSGHIHHLKRSKTSSSSKLMMNININDLPDEVLVEILGRLPCKKLVFQCRCVSKRWCTLTSDPYFIGRFVRLQIDNQTPITGTLLTPSGKDIHAAVLSPVFKRLMTVHGLNEEPVLIATYNDLVLCCATKLYQRDYYICNPYTVQWVALPPTPYQCEDPLPAGLICDIPYCNYNKEDGDRKGHVIQVHAEYRCKVLRILPPKGQVDNSTDYDSVILNMEIFSFETGEWRESTVSSPVSYWFLDYKISFAYNGMLYWWADDGSSRLIGLDPFMINNINSSSTSRSNGEDVIDYYKCRLLVKFCGPSRVYGPNFYISIAECLGECGGCLRMCNMKTYRSTQTLMVYDLIQGQDDHGQMVNDEAGNLCLKHMGVYPLDQNMLVDDFTPAPIAFDPSNKDVLYLCISKDDVVVYNIRTGEWTKLAPEKSQLTNDLLYSVVLPWWPTPVPRLPQRACPPMIS